MRSYSDALSKELKTTTLNKSFVRANEQPPAKKDEVSSFVLCLGINPEFYCNACIFFYSFDMGHA